MKRTSSPAYRIHRLQRLLRRYFLRCAEEQGFDITPEQFFVLDKLAEEDGQAQTDLADDALQDRPNLTRMLREMEAKGWLIRKSDPKDGRRRRVFLTGPGRSLHTRFQKQLVEPAREALFGGLSPEVLEASAQLFSHLEGRL